MMNLQYKEPNREWIRLDVKLPVMFMNKDMDVASAVYSEIVNINDKGACLYSAAPLNPFSEITVGLFLPKELKDSDETTFINCRAVVKYSSAAVNDSEHLCYYIGIEFTAIDKKHKKILNRFIMDVLESNKKIKYPEKRKSVRINTRLQTVLFGHDLNIQTVEYGEIKNISCNGGYVVSRTGFDPFAFIQMRIFIPAKNTPCIDKNVEDTLIRCKAKVVRLEDKTIENSPDSEFGMGVEFIDMDQEDLHKLTEFISSCG